MQYVKFNDKTKMPDTINQTDTTTNSTVDTTNDVATDTVDATNDNNDVDTTTEDKQTRSVKFFKDKYTAVKKELDQLTIASKPDVTIDERIAKLEQDNIQLRNDKIESQKNLYLTRALAKAGFDEELIGDGVIEQVLSKNGYTYAPDLSAIEDLDVAIEELKSTRPQLFKAKEGSKKTQIGTGQQASPTLTKYNLKELGDGRSVSKIRANFADILQERRNNPKI